MGDEGHNINAVKNSRPTKTLDELFQRNLAESQLSPPTSNQANADCIIT